jgi:hypothetical protein
MTSADGARGRADGPPMPAARKEDRVELDLRLQDPAALEEIELYSELIIVAGESKQPLSQAEIDRVLGVQAVKLADSH